jgi:hypothetical protein
VLYGLPDMDLNEVKKMLAVENLNPTDIKKMTIKYKKFNGHCNYFPGDFTKYLFFRNILRKYLHFRSFKLREVYIHTNYTNLSL